MLYLILLLVVSSTVLLVMAVGEVALNRHRVLTHRLAELEYRRSAGASGAMPGARRSARTQLVEVALELGRKLVGRNAASDQVRQMLAQAGYRGREAVLIFWGTRTGMMLVLMVLGPVVLTVMGAPAVLGILGAVWFATLGWLLPPMLLRRRIRARQRELLRNLPDALDLLVVCVEAGLGLNQAIVRMADELRHFNPAAGEEFALVNLEIRAGAQREVAIRNLGERTGIAELRSLAGVLVQADRFGTSVGQALRVHAESLRQARRQQVEEAAAKSTVKLVFPLVLCIFPAMFVIILGPALVQMFRALTGM